MHPAIETITRHRSVRQYKDTDVSAEDLDQIIRSAHAMPSSVNGQQVSVIVVRQAETRARIAGLAGGQPWIARAPVFLVFVMDFHKTGLAGEKSAQPQVIHQSMEGTLVGIFDAGLALAGAMVAAEALGLGVVPIGAIRKNPAAMVELLGLPEHTFPVAGLVVGHPEALPAQKPRMPLKAYAHRERYDTAAVQEGVKEYDGVMAEYYRARGEGDTDWSAMTGRRYREVYFPEVLPVLRSQGFRPDL